MKGLMWLIVLLLIIGGAMWYYSKVLNATTNRTVSAVTQTGVNEPQEAATAEKEKPAAASEQAAQPAARRSGDSLRNTALGKRINNIYSNHNKSVNDAVK